MKNKQEKIFTFKCGCGDPSDEHVTKVWIDKVEGDVCIYSSLDHYLPWYKRVLPAVKYLFGIDNTFIHYKEAYQSLSEFKEQVGEIVEYLEE